MYNDYEPIEACADALNVEADAWSDTVKFAFDSNWDGATDSFVDWWARDDVSDVLCDIAEDAYEGDSVFEIDLF